MAKQEEKKELSEADKEYIRKNIRRMGDDIIQTLREEIFLCEITCNLDRFGRLVTIIKHHTAYELLESLVDAGLRKDITKLADKAGRIGKKKNESKKDG